MTKGKLNLIRSV